MLLYDFGAGTQHQMKSIAKYDLGAEIDKFLGRHRLDRAIGADRHKCGRFDDAALEFEACAPRLAVAVVERKFHEISCPARLAMNMASP